MKLLRSIGIGVGVFVVAAYLGICGYLYFFQRDLQYDRGGRLIELSETKLTTAEVVTIPTSGGASVTGWFAPPADGMPVILFYRGNAGSFSRGHERFERFVADGYGFLSFDYRGFPGSPGELTEEGVLADSLAAFDWLAAKGLPILLWGRSLGTGPATYVASLREADGLYLETPFISAVAVAADRYGFLPVGLLMKDQYPVDLWIKDVDEPIAVAHGTADTTIAAYHGEAVYALAKNPKGIWIVPGADHDDLWAAGIWGQAKAFFEEVEADNPG